jgi:hypothetical protein
MRKDKVTRERDRIEKKEAWEKREEKGERGGIEKHERGKREIKRERGKSNLFNFER